MASCFASSAMFKLLPSIVEQVSILLDVFWEKILVLFQFSRVLVFYAKMCNCCSPKIFFSYKPNWSDVDVAILIN